MKTPQKSALISGSIVLTGIVIAVAFATPRTNTPARESSASTAAQPSLSVSVASLQPATFPVKVTANGNIMPWQEASVGTEANGLRLIDVKVNVGDTVRRGQPLATFAADTVEAELAQSRAAVAEADAALDDAAENARRARELKESGALPAQQIQQYLSAERMARARLDAAKALERMQRLRLAQTRVVAPDDGIISARTATIGAVVPAGEELFRLIRAGRLEWRAEVSAIDLISIKPDQRVSIAPTGGSVLEVRVRRVAPAVDIQTRNGVVYADLPPGNKARAGMFARGEFEIGTSEVMTLPQIAVQLREGFSYVMRVGADSRAVQTKVDAGRRFGNQVEIRSGLDAVDRVVVSGAQFLNDGDLVRVTDTEAVEQSSGASLLPQWSALSRSEGLQ